VARADAAPIAARDGGPMSQLTAAEREGAFAGRISPELSESPVEFHTGH
jgi:hypothetical protein